MNKFQDVVQGLKFTPGVPGLRYIGQDARYTVKYFPSGEETVESLKFMRNEEVYISMYQDSWDKTSQVRGRLQDALIRAEPTKVGPYCLRLTGGEGHWFRQWEKDAWRFVTDWGRPQGPVLAALNLILAAMKPYLTKKP